MRAFGNSRNSTWATESWHVQPAYRPLGIALGSPRTTTPSCPARRTRPQRWAKSILWHIICLARLLFVQPQIFVQSVIPGCTRPRGLGTHLELELSPPSRVVYFQSTPPVGSPSPSPEQRNVAPGPASDRSIIIPVQSIICSVCVYTYMYLFIFANICLHLAAFPEIFG